MVTPSPPPPAGETTQAIPQRDYGPIEQLVASAFALGSDYELAVTTNEVRAVSEQLNALHDEARRWQAATPPDGEGRARA